jgi:hypothetical protein
LAATLVLPGAASAATLTPVAVFQNAAHPVQAITLGLILAMVAAIVICGVKLSTGPALSGGSAFLSGLQLGGPLAGLLGASVTLLIMALGVSNTPAPVTVNQMAPGIAEAIMLVVLGLAAGAVAVIAKWAVDARIDRAVLKG